MNFSRNLASNEALNLHVNSKHICIHTYRIIYRTCVYRPNCLTHPTLLYEHIQMYYICICSYTNTCLIHIIHFTDTYIHTNIEGNIISKSLRLLRENGGREKKNAVEEDRENRQDQGCRKDREREEERKRNAAVRRARRQIVEQCLRSDIHMFTKVGLHLENRITVCAQWYPGPSAKGGECAVGEGWTPKTMKLQCTCTPRAQVAFQIFACSRSRRAVKIAPPRLSDRTRIFLSFHHTLLQLLSSDLMVQQWPTFL